MVFFCLLSRFESESIAASPKLLGSSLLLLSYKLTTVPPPPLVMCECITFFYSYGTYGVGCLLAPDAIWTQHFNGDLSADGKFFLQGCSVGFVGVAYLLGKIGGGEDAVKAALALSVACGVLLPWNAKFGWMTDLSTKQFHAVPEILAATLTVAGVLALN